ncbi:MAG: peptidylprolyl isomerase [Flavobacteriales bacterium]
MRRLLFQFVGCTAVCLALILSSCKSKKVAETPEPVEQTTEQQQVNSSKEEENTIPMTNVHVKITTTQGTMVVRLYDETPKHRDNFVKLVEEGFYEGLLFHRCIRNFMIQGGDPNSRGAAKGAQLGVGGPGYTVDAEFDSNLIHKKGALAAARQGDFVNPKKASSGSQFYIVQGQKMNDAQLAQMEQYVQKKNPTFSYTEEQKEIYRTQGGTAQLDMDYTVFGEVVEGLDVIDKIAALPTGAGDRPLEDVIMSMEIIK